MKTPKGTRAFYPSDAEPRRAIQETVESIIRQYGFSEVVTPAIEEAAVYAEKSGDDIVDELFLLDSDIGGGQLALTPELTPTVGKMVASEQQGLKQPIKWYSTSQFWRYEEPQQGRFREFWQTNVDLFGVGEPAAEAELLSLAIRALSALGITAEQVEVRVSDRRVLEGLIDEFASSDDETEVMRIVDKREKLTAEEYEEQLEAAGVTDVAGFNDILATDDPTQLRDAVGDTADPLVSLFDAVDSQEWLTLDVGTARGLDYYTGIVFEAFDTTGAISRSLLGGGRYDTLVESYGGSPIPAAGFAFGYAPIEEALDAYGLLFDEAGSLDAYVIRFDETATVTEEVAKMLREQGYRVEAALTDRSIGGQFGLADDRDATYAVVPGPDEVQEGKVKIQEMETGRETEVPWNKLDTRRLEEVFE